MLYMNKIYATILTLSFGVPSYAQLLASKNHPVAMGHHHLNVQNVEKNIKFWVSIGGELTTLGKTDVIKFPNVLVFLRAQVPTEGTAGSVVNHIGLQFKKLRPVVKHLKQAGTPVITESVVGATMKVDADGLAMNEAANTYLAFVRAPNGARVELYENKKAEHTVENHHIHFFTPDVDAMKAWYVEKLGAAPGQRSGMEAADVGGVNLTFSPSDQKTKPTKGRSLDHIGFEINNLKEMCKQLAANGIEFDRPYEEITSIGLAIAFFTDPWGTYIELTEGLDKL